MKRRQYSSQFKQDAVEKLNGGTYSLRKLAAELGISVVTLLKWRDASSRRQSTVSAGGAGDAPAARYEAEIARLREELVRITEERDRLRKGIAYIVGVLD
jgi:transposase